MPDLSVPARLLGYVATLGLTGAAAFQALVRRRIHPVYPEPAAALLVRIRNIAIVLGFLLVAATLFRLLAQVLILVDPDTSFTQVLALMAGSAWGKRWMLQAAAAILGLLFLLINQDTRILIPVAIVDALVAPLTGHSSENPLGAGIGAGLHGMHELGGGLWLGTLAMVVLAGYGGTRRLEPETRHRIIARLVEAFSPVALVGVTIAGVAGVVLGYLYIGSIHSLISSWYGRVLLIKVALLLITAMLGAWNWKRVRPTLGEASASDRLYRSATLELVIGTLLLAATAILVALEAPSLI